MFKLYILYVIIILHILLQFACTCKPTVVLPLKKKHQQKQRCKTPKTMFAPQKNPSSDSGRRLVSSRHWQKDR